MANWIEVKVRYEKLHENGMKTIKVTEPYLVDALSCTEAEARVVDEVSPYHQELNVTSVNKTKIAEIFYDEDGDKWYKVKYNIMTLDEKGIPMGKPAVEKKVAVFTLVQAPDFETALANFNKGMKGTIADFEIESIIETKIVDVYPIKLSGSDND